MTMPFERKKRQSASFWFQRASVDRTSPAAASSRPSRAMMISSVSAIADLVLGWLAEARHVPRYPISGPLDQLLGVHDGQTEKFDRLRRVGQPGGRFLLADEDGLPPKTLAELGGKIAHGQD